jgi:hypothetical protein
MTVDIPLILTEVNGNRMNRLRVVLGSNACGVPWQQLVYMGETAAGRSIKKQLILMIFNVATQCEWTSMLLTCCSMNAADGRLK